MISICNNKRLIANPIENFIKTATIEISLFYPIYSTTSPPRQVIPGNVDTYSTAVSSLSPPIVASALRLLPHSNHSRTVCLRWSLSALSLSWTFLWRICWSGWHLSGTSLEQHSKWISSHSDLVCEAAHSPRAWRSTGWRRGRCSSQNKHD